MTLLFEQNPECRSSEYQVLNTHFLEQSYVLLHICFESSN